MQKMREGLGIKIVKDAVLYRDDFERLIATLEGRGYGATISDGAFEYDSLDEMAEKQGTRPLALTIQGRERSGDYDSVTLACTRQQVLLTYSPSDRAQRTGHEFADLVTHRRPAMARFFSYYALGTLLTISLVLFSALPRHWSQGELWAALTAAVYVSAGTLYRINFRSVRLSRRHEGGFLARHRDQIVLLVIGAFLGALGSWAVDRLLGK